MPLLNKTNRPARKGSEQYARPRRSGRAPRVHRTPHGSEGVVVSPIDIDSYAVEPRDGWHEANYVDEVREDRPYLRQATYRSSNLSKALR